MASVGHGLQAAPEGYRFGDSRRGDLRFSGFGNIFPNMEQRLDSTLGKAVRQILKPLVRILLRALHEAKQKFSHRR